MRSSASFSSCSISMPSTRYPLIGGLQQSRIKIYRATSGIPSSAATRSTSAASTRGFSPTLPARGLLFLQGVAVEDLVLDFEENLGNGNVGGDCNEDNSIAIGSVRREEGETSSSSFTARRCFSMGSYQYVVADAQLQVALKSCSALRKGDGRGIRGTDARWYCTGNEAVEGKRLKFGSRHESFSVSKVWLWSNKKGKVSMSSDTSALDTNLPWKTVGVGDARKFSIT
ncbi:hypothetical protein GW17_00054336 [Ensete ventricosum]|nr:hypothetical protein GW17_00054336 [Ensete ventricosum]